MADSKITALPENTDPILTDILPMVDDPGGSPDNQKITFSNLKNYVFGFTTPPSTGWSWLNQAGATITTETDGSFFLNYIGGSSSGSERIRARIRTLPSPPYSIAIAFYPLWEFSTANGYDNCGLVLRQSSNGYLMPYGWTKWSIIDDTLLWLTKYTDPNTQSSQVLAVDCGTTPTQPAWLRIRDDNTNKYFDISYDGIHWMKAYSEARTTFLTADQIGFYISTNAVDSDSIGMSLVSWKET